MAKNRGGEVAMEKCKQEKNVLMWYLHDYKLNPPGGSCLYTYYELFKKTQDILGPGGALPHPHNIVHVC